MLDRRQGATKALAAVVLFGIGLAWYSFLIPIWRAPDERAHVDLVVDLAERGTYPAWDANRFQVSILRASVLISGANNRTHLEAGAAPPREDRPSLDELGGERRSTSYNHMSQHPPAYYALLAAEYRAVTALVDEDEVAAERTMGALRLLSLPLVALLPAVCWWTARRAGLDDGTAVAAALVPLCIPGLAHIGSAVNNDNLLTLLAGLALALAVGVALGDARTRTALALGAVVAAALLTKLFGVVLIPIALGAYWCLARGSQPRRDVIRSTLVCLAVIGIGLSWYGLNFIRYGAVNPSGDSSRFGAAPPGFDPDLYEWSTTLGTFLSQGFWGRPGKFEIQLPNPYTTWATVALLGLATVGFAVVWRSGRRAVALLMLATFPSVLAMVAANSYRLYSRSGQLAFMHGRYLMPAVTGMAVLFAVGLRRLLPGAERWTVACLLLVAAVMHRISVLRILGHFWGPRDASLEDTLRAAAAWSPWPGSVTLGLAAVSAVAGAWGVWVLLSSTDGAGAPPVASTAS